MKNLTKKIKVDIYDITVGKSTYSFRYEIFFDGRLVQDDFYSGSHSRSATYMRKELKKDYAVLLALQQM